ncbi:hypothetical protein Tco_0928272 [Tanacetum coccineum]
MEDDVDINTLTLEQYLAWVQDDIRPGVVKPNIENDVEFEINGNLMRELRRKLFKGTDDEDAHEHVRRVFEIADLFHFLGVTHDVVMLRVFPITLKRPALRWINILLAGVHIFYTGLYIPTRIMLDSKGFIPLMTPTQALKSIQVMADHSRNWYDEATTKERIKDSLDDVDIKQLDENIHVFQDYDIPIQDHIMQPLTPQTVHITPLDDNYVALATNPILNKHLNDFGEEFVDNTRVSKKIDSNPVNDLKELLKTYDFETFIRELLHQLSQSSHETGKVKREMKSHQQYSFNLSFPYSVANLHPHGVYCYSHPHLISSEGKNTLLLGK